MTGRVLLVALGAVGALLGLALAAVGIVLLVNPGGGSVDAAGVGFALAAAACWMAYIYLSKRTGAAFAGGSGLALAMAVGALIVLPAGLIQGEGALAEPDLLGSALVVALDQDLGARELLAIAMVVVASAGAASLSHR